MYVDVSYCIPRGIGYLPLPSFPAISSFLPVRPVILYSAINVHFPCLHTFLCWVPLYLCHVLCMVHSPFRENLPFLPTLLHLISAFLHVSPDLETTIWTSVSPILVVICILSWLRLDFSSLSLIPLFSIKGCRSSYYSDSSFLRLLLLFMFVFSIHVLPGFWLCFPPAIAFPYHPSNAAYIYSLLILRVLVFYLSSFLSSMEFHDIPPPIS